MILFFKPTAGMAVVALLLACMFVSAAEAYLCHDCSPAGTLSALSGDPSRHPLTESVSAGSQKTTGEGHSAGTCPVCLSSPLPACSDVYPFLPSAFAALQQPGRLLSALDTSIYKPPC